MEDQLQQLPIDISFSKLADWLVDRKRIPADWRKRLISIRAKVSSALPSLPKDMHPSFQNLSAEDVGYLEAKRILDVLTAAKPEARSLFGRVSGIGGDWDTIVRAYEKDHLFLGESAQVMLQAVTYEIPYLKKQITKYQQQLADVERKENEFKRSAAAAAMKYQQACQELGINGANIKAELIATTNNLSHMFRDVEQALCNELMIQTVSCYQEFVTYAYKQTRPKQDVSNGIVPSLKKLQEEHSNPLFAKALGSEDDASCVTPTIVEVTTSDNLDPTCNDSPDILDLGIAASCQQSSQGKNLEIVDDDGEGSPGLDVDFGAANKELLNKNGEQMIGFDAHPGTSIIDDSPAGLPQGDIDWDTGDVGTSCDDVVSDIQWDTDNCGQFETESLGIQWDISIEDIADDGEAAPLDSLEAHTVEPEQKSIHISGKFLESELRNSLLDDLLEIRAFLTLKLEEVKREETSSLQHQVQALLPQNIQQYGNDSFEAMSVAIFRAIGLLVDKKMQNLIMIATSQRFLKRLEESLLQKKQQESKLLANLKELGQKKLELRNMLAATWPKQEAILQRIRGMKDLCEKSISTLYEGRHINIMGEINSVLGQSQ